MPPVARGRRGRGMAEVKWAKARMVGRRYALSLGMLKVILEFCDLIQRNLAKTVS